MFAALYDWLLLLHILAAMLWLGGIVVIGAFAVRILRTREPGATAGFLGNLRVIGPLVLAPAPVILLAHGHLDGRRAVGVRPDLGQPRLRRSSSSRS